MGSRRMRDIDQWMDPDHAERTMEEQWLLDRIATGPEMTPCGVARILLRSVAASASNVTVEALDEAMDGLLEAGLIRIHDGGWVSIPGWISVNVVTPPYVAAAVNALSKLPEPVLEEVMDSALDELGALPGKLTDKLDQLTDRYLSDYQSTTSALPADSQAADNWFARQDQDQDQDQSQDQIQNHHHRGETALPRADEADTSVFPEGGGVVERQDEPRLEGPAGRNGNLTPARALAMQAEANARQRAGR